MLDLNEPNNLNNINKYDCLICDQTHPDTHYTHCHHCGQSWCLDCDMQIIQCPFCRVYFHPQLIRQNAMISQTPN